MQLRSSAFLAALALGSGVLAACNSDSSSGPDTQVDVVSSKTECSPATTAFKAGTVTFRVVNKGSTATELYVLTEGGKVVAEVENVGPGTSRTLKADLKAGEYELSCKPGQTGSGIRRKITVTGPGGGEDAEGAEETAYDREVELSAQEFVFKGEIGEIRAGDAIEFKLQNKGTIDHEFEVTGPGGDPLGEIGPTAAGQTGEVVLEFAEAGTYAYECGIDDHADRGMKGTFTVS